MKKRVWLVSLTLLCLIACFLLSGCGRQTPEPSASTEKQLTGVITQVMTTTVRVALEDGTSFLFDTTGATLPEEGLIVGRNAIVTYNGLLDVSKALQDVTVLKIEETSTTPAENAAPQQSVSHPTHADRAEEILASMTLEEKVGQMFIARCPSENAAALAKQYHLGGYILFASDFKNETKSSAATKISSYQEGAKIPMLIGVDEEGGTVNRISCYKAFRGVPFKSPQELYHLGGFDLIKSDTQEKDALLHTLGVNVNFAPVCDVSQNTGDFIYKRAFGKDAAQTAEYVKTVVAQMATDKMGSVLKHFPGYGNNADTHTDVVHDSRPYESFTASDFIPFQAGIEAGAGCILVAHNIVESMDADFPASLSASVHKILRETLGFTGVAITDDLAMDGIKKYTSDTAAAVYAVQAGNDMLTCTNFQEQIPAVLRAVQAGEISESRIDESVGRILRWKLSLGVLS